MAYQRPPFRSPFSAFALQNPMPIPGQFFNTGPPLNARPLLQGFGNPGFRLPPQLRPPMQINIHHQPRPQQQTQQPQKFRLAAPPKTTVFVGNISEEVETDLLQKMCEECGVVNSFRRMQGANGKPQAFGFVEFNHVEATRRALRLLNKFNIGGKPLLIKVEEKVMNQIHEYLNSLRQENGLLPLPMGTEFPISDEERDGDLITKKRIVEMVEAIDKNLLREPDPPPPEPKKEEKKVLSSSESEDDRREKDRERDRLRRRKHHSKERSHSPRRRSRSPRKSSRRDRDRSPKSERSSKKSRRQKHSDTEDDEAKKKDRQKRKEREEAYQRRLKKWEDKEVRFAREVEKDREKERQRRKGAEKEAKKLQLFHENYNDDVDDQKYYRGDLLIQRRRMLEQQLELDRKDRENEEAEFEKMKSEIMASNPENSTNVEEEARKRKENEETKLNIKLGIKSSPAVPLSITPDEDDDSRPAQFKVEPQNSGWESVDSPSVSLKVPSLPKKINVQTARVTTNGLFADDVEDEEEAKKKKKLQPFIISSEERIAILTPDERKRMIRDLIDKIPKSREQIFAYPMKWEYLDDAMIETRIRPWIAKKVLVALGEQEPDLTTFICECVKKRSDPKKLVLDLSMVFDEEAESFITKMWRLIIYETEARYKGLSALPSTIPST